MNQTPEAFRAALSSGDTERVNQAIDEVEDMDLEELAEVTDVTLIVSTVGDDSFVDAVEGAADQTIECKQTDLGLAYETDDFQTQVYRGSHYWQTTIPYWVDLFGVVDDVSHQPATDQLFQRELV